VPPPYVTIHAHFYQPPRENPFFDEIEPEASAAPYHDWNQRIDRECYRVVVAARVSGVGGRIARVVNTLEHVSFNVGPTLFEWMERHAPTTYRAFLEADRLSCERLDGHGNAIAQPYHHVILPLASRRDKQTEVRWGIADFRRRFGREPEGMWLPETAVDDETLDVLAEHGIRFTILAPRQVSESPPGGRPVLYRTEHGREIALCIYDGDLSHGIAFSGLVRDASIWADAILDAVPAADQGEVAAVTPAATRPPPVVSMATDGETYGHHHRFAEMALARVIELVTERGAEVGNFASYLARHPATRPAELVAPSAWSCAHGVGRWQEDCSCRIDAQRNPSQAWRAPLREGLAALAGALHAVFDRAGADVLGDPWGARDEYGALIATDDRWTHERFLTRWLPDDASREEAQRARELLEMERDALRMFTSCAWFFDDIGGIEVQQVLRYAERAMELSGERARLEPALVAVLESARSNDPATGTGADVWHRVTAHPSASAATAAAAVALRARSLDPRAFMPRSFEVALDGEVVDVRERRTGAAARFRARVVDARDNDAVSDVLPLDEPGALPRQIGLTDLPERARHAIRGSIRRALLPRLLTPDELDMLATGEVQLRGLVAVALTRAIDRLRDGASAAALEVTHAAVDLFEQLETNIPFDAQTAWWRVWQGASTGDRALLEPLGRRLGFSVVAAAGEAE
jgi:Domain of unknown function (DUF3536)/Glycosyl hydrolase family 57